MTGTGIGQAVVTRDIAALLPLAQMTTMVITDQARVKIGGRKDTAIAIAIGAMQPTVIEL